MNENMDIFKAIKTGDKASVIEYIKNNGDLNVRDFYNMTPLIAAADEGRPEKGATGDGGPGAVSEASVRAEDAPAADATPHGEDPHGEEAPRAADGGHEDE